MIMINIDKLPSIGVCITLHFYQQVTNVRKGFSEWVPTINRIVMSYDILHICRKKGKKQKQVRGIGNNGILMRQ